MRSEYMHGDYVIISEKLLDKIRNIVLSSDENLIEKIYRETVMEEGATVGAIMAIVNVLKRENETISKHLENVTFASFLDCIYKNSIKG